MNGQYAAARRISQCGNIAFPSRCARLVEALRNAGYSPRRPGAGSFLRKIPKGRCSAAGALYRG